jgi:hypothetical protein
MENINYKAKIKTIWEKIWQKGGGRQKKECVGSQCHGIEEGEKFVLGAYIFPN